MTERSDQARRIIAILADREWTYRRLARETGYSYQHVCRLMRGICPIPLRFLVACELALGLPPGFIAEERKEAIGYGHEG